MVIAPQLLVDAGEEKFEDVEVVLRTAKYPSRAVAENVADLRAQVASNRSGVLAMRALLLQFGEEKVRAGMRALFERAEGLMSLRLEEDGEWSGRDCLDDCTEVVVKLSCREGFLEVDFRESAVAHAGNLNATEGVTRSAVLYALRLWLDEDLPLNEGLLSRVRDSCGGDFFAARVWGGFVKVPCSCRGECGDQSADSGSPIGSAGTRCGEPRDNE